ATVTDEERHVMWSRDEALAKEPMLAPDQLHGAATFIEYLTDDARLVLANVKSAHAAGAVCVNHAEVASLAPGGGTTEATIRDGLSGATTRVRARVIVNAA